MDFLTELIGEIIGGIFDAALENAPRGVRRVIAVIAAVLLEAVCIGLLIVLIRKGAALVWILAAGAATVAVTVAAVLRLRKF